MTRVDGATVSLSLDELVALNNALNAARHAVRVSQADFYTLIGVERAETDDLQRQLDETIDTVRGMVSEAGRAG